MTTLFISYSRKDLDFARKLTSSLSDIGFDAWVDWNDIPPTADWWDTIEKGIESADAFLFLISPTSVTSDICNREIDHAIKNGKRVIPIVVQDIAKGKGHPHLNKLNWIFFREQDNFEESLKKLETGLKIDIAWLETHRKLQVQALEWHKRKTTSLLLRGDELQNAETQLAEHASADPAPTEIQYEFVLESRRAANRQRRIVTALSTVIGIILIIATVYSIAQANIAKQAATEARAAQELAIANAELAVDARKEAEAAQVEAETQRGIADEQAYLALAGSLSAQADSLIDQDHTLALLLGLEAYQRRPDIVTRTTLFRLLQSTPYVRVFGFNAQVSSLAVSPDGQWLAVSNAEQINILDTATHQIVFTTSDGLGIINSLSFNNDGTLLAAGGCAPEGCQSSGQITLWDMRDPQQPMQLSNILNGHTQQVSKVIFSPDGMYLASGGYDRAIIVWDVSDPGNLRPLGNPLVDEKSRGLVTSLAFSPDGKTLVSASDDFNLRIWDVSTPTTAQLIGMAPALHNDIINDIAFAPLGNGKFASVSNDRTVALWDWDANSRSLSNPRTLLGHGGFVQSAAFNADGTVLASAGFDNTVILWDAQTGERIGPALEAHTRSINTLAFGAVEGKDVLFSGSSDQTVILWGLASRQPLSHPISESSPPAEVGMSAASDGVEATAEGPQIQLTGRSEPLVGHTGNINSLSFSPQKVNDILLLASASDDQTVIVWDVTNIAEAGVFLKLKGFENPIISAFFSADGKQLTTIEKNGHTTQWIIDPQEWVSLACTTVQDNLETDQWAQFTQSLSGQTPVETCVTQ